MFIDIAKIKIKAGSGGDGAVAWRREKFEPAGGPAGGDGGDGGSVYIVADSGLHTLMDYRYKREYKAQRGQNGMSKNMFGKKGEDIVLRVPVGTLVKEANSGAVIVDLIRANEKHLIAKGGRGGRGNSRFTSATRQAPTFAEPGNKGEEIAITLELKLLADVGLIGFPNVGKSTLLSVVSAAKPKIANYHFTTLNPNLGVVSLGEGMSFVIADIPGLIEGASEGLGLGDEFLKHIERTKVLIHVLDASGSEGRDPIEDFYKINHELESYNEKLSQKAQIIFANKTDLLFDQENIDRIKNEFEGKYKVFFGSAATTKSLNELMKYTFNELSSYEDQEYQTYDEVYVKPQEKEEGIKVYIENGKFIVDGPYIEKLLKSTNFESNQSLKYFQENLRKNKVIERLKELGVEEGETVLIGGYEFEFIE